MNERILELAKQAGLKFSSETAMSPVELKFAELIIRECAEIADYADDNECEWIGGNIYTYFGVTPRKIKNSLEVEE